MSETADLLLRHQIKSYFFTYASYVFLTAGRKALSNAKQQLQDQGLTSFQLGSLDTSFLLCYAVGNFVAGNLGDRFGHKGFVFCVLLVDILLHGWGVVNVWWLIVGVMVVGVVGSGCALMLFSTVKYYIPLLDEKCFIALIILWSIHGVLASSVWPCCVAIINKWFSSEHRGISKTLTSCSDYSSLAYRAFLFH